jgi:hypothetical protein
MRIANKRRMGLTYVTVALKALGGQEEYQEIFLVESAGIVVHPKNEKLTRLPSSKLKAMAQGLIA